MPTCTKCEQELPADCFYPAGRWRRGACKKCHRAYEVARIAKNREAYLAYGAAYYAKNKQRDKEYALAHKEHRNAVARERVKQKPELRASIQARAKDWVKANPERTRVHKHRYDANSKETLTDRYVARTIVQGTGLKPSEIPRPLIDAKRLHLQILRLLRERSKK